MKGERITYRDDLKNAVIFLQTTKVQAGAQVTSNVRYAKQRALQCGRRCVYLSAGIETRREGAAWLVLVLLGGSEGEVEARQKELWTMTEQCEECQTAVNA